MRFNDLLHLVAFPWKAHGTPPTSSLVAITKMPESRAFSKFSDHFSPYIPLSRRDGAAALVHGNRGRKPRNSLPEDVAAATVILASKKYAGFNHSHLTEVLTEREGIHLSRQTVSRLLNRAGLPSAKGHRPPKRRVRRERIPQEGNVAADRR